MVKYDYHECGKGTILCRKLLCDIKESVREFLFVLTRRGLSLFAHLTVVKLACKTSMLIGRCFK